LVRHDHRERHRYRSRLRASQRGRHHRVPIGRVRDRMVHWLAAPAPPRTAWRRVTYRAEVARWPAARITLRQGARVLKNWTCDTVAETVELVKPLHGQWPSSDEPRVSR